MLTLRRLCVQKQLQTTAIGLSDSIKKSSNVASDFSCRPREAIVIWHSANLLAATANS